MSVTVFFQNAAGNDVATLTKTFTLSNVNTDPTTVICVITDPTGTQVTHTYNGAAPADITRSAQGVYQLQAGGTIAGLWGFVWVGSGAVSDVDAGTWPVQPSSLSNFYTSVEELKDRLQITTTASDLSCQMAVQAAANVVNRHCGRHFYQITETRTFVPYCCDTETEILTRNGWRRHDQVIQGDEVLTLNVGTGMSEWQPLLAVNYFPGLHETIRLSNGAHSSVSTPQHRWPARNYDDPAGRGWYWCTTGSARNDARILAAAPVWAPAQAKWSDYLVELVAWYWTEGHQVGPRGAGITQSMLVNPGNVARISAALTELFGPCETTDMRKMRSSGRPAWRQTPDSRGIVKFYLNAAAGALVREHAPEKIVSTAWLASLTRAQLDLFIQASLDADGSRLSGGWHMAQRDRRCLEAFQVACLFAGRSGEISGPDKHGMWHMTVKRSAWRRPWANTRGTGISRTMTDGVWCPTTANGTWFARRDGTVYATGNSIWEQPIDDTVSITQLAVDFNGTGVFDQVWVQGTDYELNFDGYEFNMLSDGEPRPYTRARVINFAGGGRFFPFVWPFSRLDRVQIQGTFGWPAVPFAVKQSALQIASELFKLKDSPFGIVGAADWGLVRITRQNPVIQDMLAPYRSSRREVGV